MTSLVLETAPDGAEAARSYFLGKLAHETDASDVHEDLRAGVEGFVVVDPRSPEAYARGHVPGAVSLPHRTIDRNTAAGRLPAGKTLVLCAAGPGCNAAHKAAVRLAALGWPLKEMIGGLESWQKSGYPVQTGAERGRLS